MPAIVIEAGFLSNKRDRDYLTNHLDIVAQEISKELLEYLL